MSCYQLNWLTTFRKSANLFRGWATNCRLHRLKSQQVERHQPLIDKSSSRRSIGWSSILSVFELTKNGLYVTIRIAYDVQAFVKFLFYKSKEPGNTSYFFQSPSTLIFQDLWILSCTLVTESPRDLNVSTAHSGLQHLTHLHLCWQVSQKMFGCKVKPGTKMALT